MTHPHGDHRRRHLSSSLQAFKKPLVTLKPETTAMLKLPLRLLMQKSEKYFMLDFIRLLVSPRRDAAEEYVKSACKAEFTYFQSAESKARFGDYFSKSKCIKLSHEDVS